MRRTLQERSDTTNGLLASLLAFLLLETRSYERTKGHRYERSNRTLLAIHFDAKGPTNGLPATQPRVHVGQTREGEGGKRAQAMS